MIFITDNDKTQNINLDKSQDVRYVHKVTDITTDKGSFPLYVESKEPPTIKVKSLDAFGEVEKC